MKQVNVKQDNYLTLKEINQLLVKAKKNKESARDTLIVLLSFRHGLRISELISLTWKTVNTTENKIWIDRLKNGKSGYHPLANDELKLLKKLKQKQEANNYFGDYIFISNRFTQLSRTTAYRVIKDLVKQTGLSKQVTPHALRHSCGYYLANKDTNIRIIQDYLGHQKIENTALYTAISENRYKGLFDK